MKHILLALTMFMPLASPSQAVTFDIVEEETFTDWTTYLFRNQTNGELFCAAQTRDAKGTIFRLNFYRSGDAFLEVFNPTWEFEQGATSFSLHPDNQTIALNGDSWPDAITMDLITDDDFLNIVGPMLQARSLAVHDANNVRIALFSTSGASSSIKALQTCRAEEFS